MLAVTEIVNICITHLSKLKFMHVIELIWLTLGSNSIHFYTLHEALFTIIYL